MLSLSPLRAAGLLWSADMSETETSHHRFAVVQRFDYVNNAAYEWGGQAFTAGLMSKFKVSETQSFLNGFFAGTMLMAGTKSDYENFTGRSYDYGPGAMVEYTGILARNGQPVFEIRHTSCPYY